MRPIFTTAMDGVVLPKPWQPTYMRSYAKGRPPHRVWTKMVTNREAERDRARNERESRKKIDAVIRRIAGEVGCTQRKVRDYAISQITAQVRNRMG